MSNSINDEILNFDFDVHSSFYRIHMSDKLVEYSKVLFSSFSSDKAKLYSTSIMNYINSYDNPMDFKKEEFQGLFYLMSIFNAIERSKIYSKDVEITPYEGYITGLTPFRAKEDIILNSKHLNTWLDNYSGTRLAKVDIEHIKSKHINFSSMSLKEHHERVHLVIPENKQHSKMIYGDDDDCFLLCGGDCGCCGNYEGQCYYAHAVCYIHDYLCENCEPNWFCFSGCQPTPCGEI